MKRFETYPEKNIDEMISGLVAADLGIEFIKKGIVPLSDDLRQAAEKFLVDEETEESEPAKGTRRPSDRAVRRKATAKAKRKAKRNEPFTCSLVDHGEYVIHKGNTHSWHPEWKRIDRRIRRHEGKNLCFNYEADDVATETEDWEDWLLPEDIELLEELEETERQEWLRDLENFQAKQELEIWEPEDWEPEDDDEDYMETLEAMEEADRLEWLEDLEDEVYGTGIERECSDYRMFLTNFNLWTLFYEWKKRKEG